MAEQSLKEKTVKGVAWSGVDNIAQTVVTFIVGVILARLLTPDDYGLVGIIAIFTSICNSLINAGFSSALIRKIDVAEEDYNTVFFVNFIMSLLLYAIIYLLAPLIASFFGREELVMLTRVTTIGIIIGAFALVQQTKLTKKIDFKTQTIITVISTAISGSVGIIMACIGFGVWSLVVQGLTLQTLRTVLLWILNKWAPSFRFSISSFKELFGFGWKMMLSGLIDNLWQQLNKVVIGKYYLPATLGQYTRSVQFSELFSNNLTIIVQRVTYPVLSSIQDDKERMVGAYRKVIKTSMFVTAVSMFSLGAVSEPLLYCLIGPQWKEAATFLPLLCISGSLYPLHAINLNMLQVQGRSDLFLVLEIIKKIIALAPLFVGVFVGIMPMLYLSIVTGIISFFLNSHYSGKFLGYSALMQLKDVAPSYLIALAIAMSVWFFKYLPVSNWIILLLQIIVGTAVFLVANRFAELEEYREIEEMVFNAIKKYKKH